MGKSLKEYFAALGKWGWAVAIIIAGDIYGIAASYLAASSQRQFFMPIWGWWLILGLILLISPFIAFHKMRVERDKIIAERDALLTKPKPKLETYANPYTDKRYLRKSKSDEIVAQVFCANQKFMNSPDIRTPEASASKVYAEATFYDVELTEILKVDRLRCSDIPEPSYQIIGVPNREYYEVEFNANGNTREYTIAIKHEEDVDCYAFSDHNYFYPSWKNPEYLLKGNKFWVKFDLNGDNTQKESWFILLNHGKGKNIELQIAEKPNLQ